MVNVFVDMDGVIALNHDEIRKYMYDKNFFLDRPPVESTIEAIKVLQKKYSLHIISTIIDSPYCASEKKEWLQRHLPELDESKIILVPHGESKAYYANKYAKVENAINILIDDYTHNLNDWYWTGIKVLNGDNNTTGSWISAGGPSIDIKDSPEKIVQLIEEEIKKEVIK